MIVSCMSHSRFNLISICQMETYIADLGDKQYINKQIYSMIKLHKPHLYA